MCLSIFRYNYVYKLLYKGLKETEIILSDAIILVVSDVKEPLIRFSHMGSL